MLIALAALLALLAAACSSDDGDQASSRSASVSASASASASAVAATATASPNATSTGGTLTIIDTTPAPDQPLYLALGDSLSYGNGASDHSRTAFVPLVRDGLGASVGLLNLGVPGYTSADLLNKGELDTGLAEITKRQADGIHGNEVKAVTLEIGGNDLLNLYFNLVIPGKCPTVTESLKRPECVAALQDILAKYRPNLQTALQNLKEADPALPIFLMTLYNPFSGGSSVIDSFGELSLEGMVDTPFPEGLNDTIRQEAANAGVHLVEWYPLFEGKAGQYIANDFIHPNDTGYRVMADAVLQGMSDAGVR